MVNRHFSNFSTDWENSEEKMVVEERRKDIRESKYIDWFATLSYILVVVGLDVSWKSSPILTTGYFIAMAVFGAAIITLIAGHMAGREEYRGDIYHSLPSQSNNWIPYCNYRMGFTAEYYHSTILREKCKEIPGWVQIFAVLTVIALKCMEVLQSL